MTSYMDSRRNSAPENDIEKCLHQLSETQTYIRDKEKRLKEERDRFEIERARKEQELKRAVEIHEERVTAAKDGLKKEIKAFEETKTGASPFPVAEKKTHIITLNVGGEKFWTDIRTLQGQRDSIFPDLMKKIGDRRKDRNETCVFIDRDSKHFRFFLNYMRQGEEVFRLTALRGKDTVDLEEMICEARYYRLNGFMKLLERHRVRLVHKIPTTFANLVGRKYFKVPFNLSSQNQPHETTQQNLFKNINMAGIEFECVHFKHSVSFEGSILVGAKFKRCRFDAIIDFTDADITNVSFDHCVHATPDRFMMDGVVAEKCRVTFNPPVDLSKYSITYTT